MIFPKIKPTRFSASRPFLLVHQIAVALLELVHTAAGIDKLLLAGIERVALGTNFHLQLGLSGSGRERRTAYAANDRLTVLGMDAFLHQFSPLLRMLIRIHGARP